MNVKAFITGALVCFLFAAPAQARHRHVGTVAAAHDPGCNVTFPCDLGSKAVGNPFSGAREIRVTLHREHRKASLSPSNVREMANRGEGVIGGRPSGCPYQFCGCGASLYLFGRIIPELNLARNWGRFPSTNPAPRMAAWRSHHIMVLEEHVEGSLWVVHDSNSGGHLTRRHVRSIAGYNVVNPFASIYASNN